MKFHVFALAALIVKAASQCPEVTSTGCLVCGDNKSVGNPSAIFVFPGQPSVPCGVLETAGLSGLIPTNQCVILAPLLGSCECDSCATKASEDGGETDGDEASGDGSEASGDGSEASGDGGEASGDRGEASGDGGETSGDGGETSGDGGETIGSS